MAEPTPTRVVNCTDTWFDGTRHPADPMLVINWDRVRDWIAGANTYWVTTVRADGSPHTRPVFAVWTEGQLCSTTNPDRAKARHLSRNQLTAPFGAPAAGPPPYRPYALTPTTVYAMGTTEELAPRSTRFSFG